MSTQHMQDVLLPVVNSDQFAVTRSYSNCLFLCGLGMYNQLFGLLGNKYG